MGLVQNHNAIATQKVRGLVAESIHDHDYHIMRCWTCGLADRFGLTGRGHGFTGLIIPINPTTQTRVTVSKLIEPLKGNRFGWHHHKPWHATLCDDSTAYAGFTKPRVHLQINIFGW